LIVFESIKETTFLNL